MEDLNMMNFIRGYIRQTRAAIIILFALMAPMVIGAAGMALDYAMAYLVQQRLAQAVDAAALAAAASSSDAAEIERKVEEFFAANYPPEKLGATFDPEVTVSGDEIYVSGSAVYGTMFLGVLGIYDIDVEADTTVQREVQGLEVVLVLDNTGSMATNNNIGSLRDASEAFVDILFDSTNDAETIKIGLVPYSSSVRVGRYGLGMNPDGSEYGDGYEFVNLPDDMSYTTDKTSYNWFGCVVEHNSKGYTDAATYVSKSKGQLWRDTGGNPDGHGWDPRDGDNDPYDYDVLDDYEGPWDVYSYGRVISKNQECDDYGGYNNSRCSNCTGSGGNCNSDYCFCYRSSGNGGTNKYCPEAYLTPLSSDRDALQDVIEDMKADGYTYGNIGLAWGGRVLSPAKPFEEGSDWDNEYWRKAVIMMTDGNNTMESTYSMYWDTRKHNIGVADLNNRFAETCEDLKEKGVTIYTVTFSTGTNSGTKDDYEECASSSAQYHHAPSQEELVEVFEKISRELSQLYIKD